MSSKIQKIQELKNLNPKWQVFPNLTKQKQQVTPFLIHVSLEDESIITQGSTIA